MEKQLLKRFSALLVIVTFSLIVLGCQERDASLINSSIPAEKFFASSNEKKMYHTLVAEMYRAQGDDTNATMHFEKVLDGNTSIALAKVATKTAAQTAHLDIAIMNAKHWISLKADLVEARQYLALLLLRSNQFQASAHELNEIYRLINESGYDGLSFVTSLISLESHQAQAIKAFEDYIRQYNPSSSAYLKLAELALQQQEARAALNYLGKISNSLTTSEKEVSLVLRSKALHQKGLIGQSIEIMHELVRTSDVDDMTRLEYARLLMLNNDELAATEQLQVVYFNTPSNLEVLKSLVGLRISQGQFQRAEEYAMRLADNTAYANVAHHYLAEIHESRNEMDEALREYRKVGDGDYFNSAQRRISELLVEQYSLEIATNWLSEVRQQATTNDKRFLYSRLEARLRARYNDQQGALDRYHHAYQLDSSNVRMNFQYAMVAKNLGERFISEQLLIEIIEKNPANADAYNALGYMLLEDIGRVNEASLYLAKAYELRPNDAVIMNSWGWLNFKQGNIDKAASLLMAAYEKSEDLEIANHLIEVLITQGQVQKAMSLLSRVMEQFPDNEQLKSIKKKIIETSFRKEDE